MFAKAFSAFGPALGLAMVGGPVLAGFLIDANIAGTGWRALFLINIVLGSVGFVAALRVLPATAATPPWCSTAWVRACLPSLCAACCSGSSRVPAAAGLRCRWPASSPGCSPSSPSAGARRRRGTLIKPSLLANRSFTSGLLMGLGFSPWSPASTTWCRCSCSSACLSPSHAALALVPLVLGIVAASVVAMGLIAKLGRTLILLGLMVSLAGIAWLLELVLLEGTGATRGCWRRR